MFREQWQHTGPVNSFLSEVLAGFHQYALLLAACVVIQCWGDKTSKYHITDRGPRSLARLCFHSRAWKFMSCHLCYVTPVLPEHEQPPVEGGTPSEHSITAPPTRGSPLSYGSDGQMLLNCAFKLFKGLMDEHRGRANTSLYVVSDDQATNTYVCFAWFLLINQTYWWESPKCTKVTEMIWDRYFVKTFYWSPIKAFNKPLMCISKHICFIFC